MMTIVQCPHCLHFTHNLFHVPNIKTGVADRYCKSCFPTEAPDTLPDDLKDNFEKASAEVKAGKYDPEPAPAKDDDEIDTDAAFDELYDNDDDW